MIPYFCYCSNKSNHLEQIAAKYGTILKRETLCSVSIPSKTEALVLMSKDPFPGFYCSEKTPTDNSCKDFSWYLPVAPLASCHEDHICRISLKVRKKTDIRACPAQICLKGKYTRAIRLKNLKPKDISSVIEIFVTEGVEFHKPREIKTFLSTIYLRSFFELHALSDRVFQNAHSKDLYYLVIPENMEWLKFEQLITYQKSKSSFRNFDAAIGYWMQAPEFIDFIRIYGKSMPLEKLENIREEFLENLKMFNKDKILI